jgi:hypothetical protein
MKRFLPFLFAGFITFTTITAHAVTAAIAGKGFISDDERTVKDFNGIASGGPIEVIVKMGSTESIRFEGDAEAIATLVTEVKSNILIIRPKTSWRSWSSKYDNKKIIAYVTAKNITSLTMSGNGSINVSGKVTASEMTTTLSGSGSIKASIDVDELTSVLSGSGSLNITGTASKARVTISGSGAFSGKTLAVDDLSTKISGSGSVFIRADRKIDAVIVGSGNVNYSGDPEVEKRVIGSGTINKV